MALCIVPCGEGVVTFDYRNDGTFRAKSTTPSPKPSSPSALDSPDLELGNFAKEGSTKNAIHSLGNFAKLEGTTNNTANSTPPNMSEMCFGLTVLDGPSTRSATGAEWTPCSASSQLLCTSGGHLFSSVEIFGMKAGASISGSPQKMPVTSLPSPENSSGRDSLEAVETDPMQKPNNISLSIKDPEAQAEDDECVVCLSDSKAVVLMPCRYVWI
jgi:hypothetical protein